MIDLTYISFLDSRTRSPKFLAHRSLVYEEDMFRLFRPDAERARHVKLQEILQRKFRRGLPITINFSAPEVVFAKAGNEWLVNYIKTEENLVTEVVTFDVRVRDRDRMSWFHKVDDGYEKRFRERPLDRNSLKTARTRSDLHRLPGDPEFGVSPLSAEVADFLEVWRVCSLGSNHLQAYQVFAGISSSGEIRCVLLSSGEGKKSPTAKREK